MFRDAKKELERLEAELLAADQQDAADAELDAALERFLMEEDESDHYYADDEEDYPDYNPKVYRNYSNNYGRNVSPRNTDQIYSDIDSYSDDVYQDDSGSLKGLIITALLLLFGIFGMLGFWYVRYLW